MATNITAQERTNILKLVAGMFNAVPGATYLEEFSTAFLAVGNDYGSLATALGNTGAFKSLYPSSLTVQETANKFLGTLGLANNAEAQDFVQAKLNAGEGIASVVFQSLLALVNSTSTDAAIVAAQAQLANKAAVAEHYSVTLGASSADLATLQGIVANVTADPASVDAAKESSNGANGTTFMLTKGLDNFEGKAGNDTIIGSVGAADLNTFSVLDIINGGAGTDTLKVTTEGGTAGTNDIVVGANVTNVEIVEVSSAAGLTVDASAATGVQTLNVIGATGAAAAKAAATTDIAVKLNAATSNAITTQGGKNVSVELSNAAAAADSVTVGQAGVANAAKGDVTVSVTGKAHVAGETPTLGAITVNGGKTISVTQKATTDGAAAATSKVANSVTQGNVTIVADKTTTEVTVKQDATVAGKSAVDTTGGVTESVSVKFGALKATDSVTVGGLIFTAKVDLTAAEVAAAFANLTDAKVPTVGQDTQGSGLVTSKGTYSGTFDASVATGYTSAAANGDTVVFTSVKPNFDQAALTVSGGTTVTGSVAPVPTVTQGKAHNATPAGGVLAVNAGTVAITGDTALKTVTLDGFAAGSSIASATALETLNAANTANGTLTVGASAETLSINLNNFGTAAVRETLTTAAVTAATATVDLDSTTAKTLNVKVEGKSNAVLDIAGATSATALNVSGSQTLAVTANAAVQTVKVTESAGVTLTSAAGSLTSVDTTGTTGTSTVTIDGGKATYAGGAGVDNVTVSAVTGGVLNKSINLGAGDDKLDLSNAALTAAILKAIPTANQYQGGEGTDTIVLTAANAVELSADSTFAGKIDGFEKLSITNATATGTVNLANLDNINYVVSANSTAVPSAAVTENGLVTFQALTAGQSVTIAGRTVTVSAGTTATATEIAAAFLSGNPTTVGANGTLTVSGALADWTAAANATGQLKFTSTTPASNVAPDLVATDAGLTAATSVAAGTKTDGAVASPESTVWTMNGLTNGQSYTISGLTVTANKTLTATEVAAAFVAGTTSAGNFTVSGAYVAPTGWTLGTFSNIAGALTLTNGANGDVGDFIAAPTANGAGASPTDAAVSEYVQGAAAGVTTSVGLTIDNLTSGGTLELTATGAGVNVNVKDAVTGTADVLNVVANATGNLGTVKAAEVETINISSANKTTSFTTLYTDAGVPVKVADAASSSQIILDANAAKAVTVAGAGKLTLNLANTATKVATVDASTNTGGLTLDLTAHNGVAVTVTGGAGNDELKASVGTNAKADVLVGGAGNDTLYVGSNGAKLTGGEGNDLFVVAANAGTKEANTYSSITDFQAGDVLKLEGLNTTAGAFAKLTANLNENTSVFANFVDAAIAQASLVSDAVWFQFKGNAYVVVDHGVTTGTFENGTDTVVELVGVDLNNATFNSTNGTVALI